MPRVWEADPAASFKRRLGKSAVELDKSLDNASCPDIWELDNGDVAVIGRDLTVNYAPKLPTGVKVDEDERVVIIPGVMLRAAKGDISDA
jgi:hypothetical protein